MKGKILHPLVKLKPTLLCLLYSELHHPVIRNSTHLTKKHILTNGKSGQSLDMALTIKTSTFVRTCRIVAWASRTKIAARQPRKINHDLARCATF